jgi:hypothetical protein
MKDKIFLLLCIVTVILISCSLDKSNPLDPIDNPDVFYPPEIEFANVNATQHFPGYELKWYVGKYVTATYDSIEASGYYLYGAMEYNSQYNVIAIKNKRDTTFNVEDLYHVPGFHWFKVSSYIVYTDTLEGHRSKPVAPSPRS